MCESLKLNFFSLAEADVSNWKKGQSSTINTMKAEKRQT